MFPIAHQSVLCVPGVFLPVFFPDVLVRDGLSPQLWTECARERDVQALPLLEAWNEYTERDIRL